MTKLLSDIAATKLLQVGQAIDNKQVSLGKAPAKSLEYFADMGQLDESAFTAKHGVSSLLDYRANQIINDAANPNYNRNQNMMQDLGTAAAVSLGDNVPKLVSGLGALATPAGSGAYDWFMEGVKGQGAEAEASQANYSQASQDQLQEVQELSRIRGEAFDQIEDPTVGDYLGDFFSATGEVISNPRAAGIFAAESADSLVTMPVGGAIAGGIAKQAVKKGLQNLTKKEVAKAQAKVAKAQAKAAGAVGTAYTGVSEGGHNAIGAILQVEDMSHEKLLESPEYREILEQNPTMRHEDAKTKLAQSIGRQVGLSSGALAAVIGKATGASDVLSKALLKGDSASKIATRLFGEKAAGKIIKGTLGEAAEETLQSGSGQALSNIGVQRADASVDTMEGVTDAAAQGAVAGGLTGGVVPAVKETVKAAAKGTVKATAKVAEKVQKVTPEKTEPVEEASRWGELEDKELEKKTTKALEEVNVEDMNQAYLTLAERAGKEKNEKKKAYYTEQLTKVSDRVEELLERKREILAQREAKELTKEDVSGGVALAVSDPASEYSADLSQKLSGSKHLTENQKNLLQVAQDKNSPVSKLLGKTREEVADDIFLGGEGYTGLKEYTEIIGSAIQNKDQNGAIRAIRRLKTLNDSHRIKATTGKTHQKQDIGADLLEVIQDESVAINQIYLGLKDSVNQAFPEYKELQSKMTDRVNALDTPTTTKEYSAPKDGRVTLSTDKKLAIVGESIGTLLTPEESKTKKVAAFRRALASTGSLGESNLPALRDTYKEYQRLKEEDPSALGAIRKLEKELLGVFDTLVASDIGGGVASLQEALVEQSEDKSVADLFIAGRKDRTKEKELETLKEDIKTKRQELKKVTEPEERTQLQSEIDSMETVKKETQEYLRKSERGEIAFDEVETEQGHSPEYFIKKDSDNNREKYENLYSALEANKDKLSDEQIFILEESPKKFNDLSDNVVESYNRIVKLFNEAKIPNAQVSAQKTNQEIRPTVPSNRVLSNLFESFPLLSGLRKAFKLKPKSDPKLFQIEANLFEKIAATDSEVGQHLVAGLTQETKEELVDLASLVNSISKAVNKVSLKPNDRDESNWINTPIESFLDTEGKLDPVVADAIGLALADFLAMKGMKTIIHNSDETIAHNLGMSGEEAAKYVPTKNEKGELRQAGINRNQVIQTLGKSVYSTLGLSLREDTNDAQRHLEETLISNLGILALVAGENQGTVGLLETNYLHRYEWETSYGTSRVVILTPEFKKPSDEVKAEYGVPADVKVFSPAPAPIIRAKKHKNLDEEGNVQLPNLVQKGIKGMRNTHLTNNILGTGSNYVPVYTDSDQMPKSEDYQSYASSQEHEAINNLNSIRYKLNSNLFSWFQKLSPKQQEMLMDDLPEEGEEHTSTTDRIADIRHILELEMEGMVNISTQLEDPETDGIRFKNKVAKSNRRINQVGTEGTPVGSKLVREMLVPEGQIVTIDPNNQEQMLAFQIAVMHGLDDKVNVLDESGQEIDLKKGIDKSIDAAVVKGWEKVITDPKFIAVMNNFDSDPTTVFDVLEFAGVKSGAGNSQMHKVHALQALATWHQSEGKPFTVFLGKEDDGIVNGTANLLMQMLGSVTPEEWFAKAAQVGIYPTGDLSHNSFAEYTQEEGNLDPYETLGSDMTFALTNPLKAPASDYEVFPTMSSSTDGVSVNYSWIQKQFKDKTEITTVGLDGKAKTERRLQYSSKSKKTRIRQTPQEYSDSANAVNFILNYDPEAKFLDQVLEIARSFTKNPLMQYNYQAGLKGLKRAMTGEITGAVTHALESINRIEDPEAREAAKAQLERAVNSLSFIPQNTWNADKKEFEDKPWVFKVGDNPLETPVNKAVINDIAIAIEFTFGPAMDYAFKKNYSALRENTSHVVNVTRMATFIFNEMYRTKEAELLAETGQISLSVKQEKELMKELRQYSPAVAHAFSQDRLNDGMTVGSKESVINRENGKIINPEANAVKMEYKGRKGKKTSISTVTYSPKIEDPGVSAPGVFTQSTDAATQKKGAIRGDSFTNVHDAKIISILGSKEMTQQTNQDFLEVHQDYSFMDASLEMFREMLKSPDATAGIIDEVFNQIKHNNEVLSNFSSVDAYLEYLEEFNTDLQEKRKLILKDSGLKIHQFYNSDGSGFEQEQGMSLKEINKRWNYRAEEKRKEAAWDSLGQRHNRAVLANSYIQPKFSSNTSLEIIFPEETNKGEYTSEDVVLFELPKGKLGTLPSLVDVKTNEVSEVYSEVASAIEEGAQFITSNANTILHELNDLKAESIGGDIDLILHLNSQGYSPDILHGQLIWTQTNNPVPQNELVNLLHSLAQDELSLYAPYVLPKDFSMEMDTRLDLNIQSLGVNALRGLQDKYPTSDPRTTLIQNELKYRQSIQQEETATVRPETLKIIKELSDDSLMNRLEKAYGIAPEAALTQALIVEYDARFDDPNRTVSLSITKPEVTEQAPVKLTGRKGLSKTLLAKDQAKSDQANKFIGFGKGGSSTAQYQEAWGDRANTGEYTAEDKVFISVSPNLEETSPTIAEVDKALVAGATIIADNHANRNRKYNRTGEGRLARYLTQQGYEEVDSGSGVWTPTSPQEQTYEERIEELGIQLERVEGKLPKALFYPSTKMREIQASLEKNPEVKGYTAEEVTAAKLLKATTGTEVVEILQKHFVSPMEKVIFSKIAKRVQEGAITDVSILAGYGLRIEKNTHDVSAVDVKTGALFFAGHYLAKATPSEIVSSYLAALDNRIIHEGLRSKGVEESRGYKGLVALWQEVEKTEVTPTKDQITQFVVDGRHDKNFKNKLENTNVLGKLEKYVKAFLRHVFKLDVETVNAYEAMMGYAAQSIYSNKYISPETSQQISYLEGKKFRKEARKKSKETLISLLLQGKAYAEAKEEMLSNEQHKDMFQALEKTHPPVNFSSPVTADQFKSDSAVKIEQEMEFDKTNTMEVFRSLGQYRNDSSEGHKTHLTKMVNMISPAIDKLRLLVRTEGIEESYGSEQGGTLDLRINTGAKANNLEMSAQEIYIHEMYHAALRTIGAKKLPVWKKITKEYNRALKHLKVEDFLAHIENPTAIDVRAAYELMDHALYNNTSGSISYKTYLNEIGSVPNADPVEEFAVLAVTNQAVMNALRNLDTRLKGEETTKEGILGKIISFFEVILEALTEKIYSLKGLTGDARMVKLTELLIASQTAQQSLLIKAMNKADSKIDETGDWVKEKLGNMNFMKGLAFAKEQHQDSIIHNVRKYISETRVGKNELFVGIVREFSTGRLGLAALTKLLTKSTYFIERKSQQLMEYVQRELTNLLPELTDEESEMIYTNILESDAQSLLNYHSWDDTYELLTNQGKRDARENTLVAQLLGVLPSKFGRFMLHHTNDIANHMLTGERLLADGMYTNAYQLAHLWGMEGKKPKYDAEVLIPILDELITLKALTQVKGDTFLTDLFDSGRYSKENLEHILLLQKEVVDISATEAFEGNTYNMRKGYVRETVESDVQVLIGTASEELTMNQQGFVKEAALVRDKDNIQGETHYYYVKQGSQQTYLTGVLSIAHNATKGANIFEPTPSMEEIDIHRMELNFKDVQKRKQLRMQQTMNAKGKLPILPTKQRGSVLQPLFDSEGKITGYRQILPNSLKDSTLKRDKDFKKAIGYTLAGISRKKNSETINNELMDYLYETYESDYKKYPEEFIEVSPVSNKDTYYLIPQAAREYGKSLYGSDSFWVRREEVDIAFGYRKFSVAQLKHRADPTGKLIGELLRHTNNLANTLFNNRIGISLEEYIQAFVSTAKDTIVVKSGVVTGYNILSNVLLLWWKGVPLATAVADHVTAYKGVIEYNKKNAELFALKREMNNPYLTDKELRVLAAKRNKIQNEMYHNPVRELIEAGAYQTIVEDVDTSEKATIAKNKLDELLEPIANKTPSAIKTIGKNFLMTHDTKFYQVMRDAAQISDFAARYSLHKHNMEKGVGFDESIRDIKTTFIDYDMPQMKALQYLNDMGLMGFTKYLFRLQQVLIKGFGDRPARAMMLVMLSEMYSGISNPIQGIITGFDAIKSRMGLDWWGALDNSITAKTVSMAM